MTNFIKVYDNVVTKEYCEEVIDWFNDNQSLQHNRQNTNDGGKLQKLDQAILLPAPRVLNITNGNFFFHKKVIDPVIKVYYEQYANDFPQLLDMQRQTILQSKIQATEPGGGYHLWHCEHTNLLSASRVASFVLYLNEVDGGETEFLHQHQRVDPKHGRLVIFPAGYTHLHRGNPPLNNTKYITTGWMEYC